MVTSKKVYSDNTIDQCEINRIAVALAPDYSLVVVAYCGDTIARVYNYRGRHTSTAQLYNRLYQDYPLADFIHYTSN